MAGFEFSRRDSLRVGGIAPFWVKGTFPLRCEDVPLEFVRAIDGADRWESVLRCGTDSIRSEEGCLDMEGTPLLDMLRGTLLRRC